MEKVVYLGGNGVGKTSFIERLHSEQYVVSTSGCPSADYVRTTEASTTHVLSLPNGRRVMMELIDTTGEETLLGDDIRNMHIVFGDAFVVMFSVNDKSSFSFAEKILEEVARIKITLQHRQVVPILLVGSFSGEHEGTRQVGVDEGRQLASSYLDCSYTETSNRSLEDIKLMEGWMINRVVLRSSNESGEKGVLSICRKVFSKASRKVRRRSTPDIFEEDAADEFCYSSSTFKTGTLPRTKRTSPSVPNAFTPDSRKASYFRVMKVLTAHA